MTDPAVSTDAPTGAVTLADFVVGAEAPADLYVAHGRYEEVPDLDPTTGLLSETITVEIEKVYPTDKVTFELGDGERGNVLVAKGTVVSDEVAAKIASAQ